MMDLMNEAQVNEGLTGLKPIPLTEEWLLKFGFEKVACIHEIYEIETNLNNVKYFNIQISEGALIASVDCYGKETNIAELKYVHSLQNLYHALTGEELELKTVSLNN